MRALVIGTTGQLATELFRRSTTQGIELLPAAKVDLADEAALVAHLDQARPEAVLNAGAYTAVDKAEAEAERAYAVNAAGPAALARWCQANGALLVHVSTDYVFDGNKREPYVESDPTLPINAYGASKLAGEEAIRAALARHVILRTSWVFSAHGANFVKTMLRLARERDELRVVDDQHGRPTAASDLADAVLGAARTASQREAWGTFHFANAGACTWHGFASAIVDEQASATGRRPAVVPITSAEFPTPARRPVNSVLSTARFESAFGAQPRPWRDALREVVTELAGR